MFKGIKGLLAALAMATCAWAQVWDGSADTTWYTNNKSATSFTITTPAQLAGLARLVNGVSGNGRYNMSGKTITLGNDIMLNDTTNWKNWATTAPDNEWTAIGTGISISFEGTFDGAGHVVSGVYINQTLRYQGLFGYVYNSSTIKNLGVVASYIASNTTVGGLAGYNRGTITNSYATGNVTGTSMYIGGLVGENYGTITNSYATGKVTGTSYVGGLVGYNESGVGSVTNSYYDRATSGQTGSGQGTSKTTAEMKSQPTYIGWDFGTIWAINPAKNDGYPYHDIVVVVTGISSTITSATYNQTVALNATVSPSDATNKTVVWSVVSGGATISGNNITFTQAGQLTIKATITNGLGRGSNYTQDFNINVAKATGTFAATPALNTTYTQTLTLANVTPPANYAWVTPATTLDVSKSGQSFAATYTDPSGNYNPATGNITVNVAKATRTFVATSALNTTYTQTLTLANVTPPANYAWNAPTTSLSAGSGQSFAATYTDPSGNYNPATGNITVNVAKAAAPTGTPRTEHVSAGYEHTYHFDLAMLLPNIPGFAGLTYSPAITDNASGILGTLSYASGNTLEIPVNNASGAGLTATIAVTVSSTNYEDFTAVITVETVNKTLVDITGIAMPDGVYNGNPHGYTGTPVLTRDDNSETVTGVTLEVTYEATDGKGYSSTTAPTNAGSYRLTLKVPDNSAYIGEEEYEFTIAKANGTGTVAITGWTYGQPANSPTISGKTAEYGEPSFTYSAKGANSYTATVPTNAGEYTVKATFAATENYNEHSATADFAIAKANGTGTVAISGWTYGQPANTPTISGQTTEYGEPSFTYSAKGANSYTATVPTEAGEYTVKATFAATANYNEHTATVDFGIMEVTITLPQIAGGNRAVQTHNGINLTATSNATVEIYGLNGNLIIRRNFASGVYAIQLEHLPKGLYIAKVLFDSEKQILRVPVR